MSILDLTLRPQTRVLNKRTWKTTTERIVSKTVSEMCVL
jgi:hypothetical protein